ncbi:MAG TPA: ABC transporter permease [Thermoanaerobaculia bacterium]|nr:ABC transporter permease [Thermoanaerobaculia bacterium]
MRDWLLDARFAIRTWRKVPGISAVILLTIGLAIGANTAIFSVVDGVLLRPLRFKDPGKLVMLWEKDSRNNVEQGLLSPADFSDFRRQSTAFEDLGAIYPYSSVNLTGEGDPERLDVSVVSPSVFTILGAAAETGRTFLPEESQAGNSKVVVLSHGFWLRRFAAKPLLGKALLLNNEPYTVVGVMPAWFQFPSSHIDMWLPLALGEKELAVRQVRILQTVGRLKPGVSRQQAAAEASAIASRLEREHPDTNAGADANLVSLTDQIVGDVRRALLILAGAVGCILLIACANMANLLLARAAGREREVAIRQAIGAGRRRLIRQMLTESVLLSLLGGALGLVLAFWGIQALIRLSPGGIPRLDEVRLDPRALLFTLLISVGAGLLFGIVPALQSSRGGLVSSLKEGARNAGRAKRRLFNTFVIVEVALALVLLSGAGLLIRSFLRLQDVRLGFQPANLLTASVSLPRSRYPQAGQRAEFYTDLIERVGRQPQVRAAGAITFIPMGGKAPTTALTAEGRTTPAGEQPPELEYRVVTPGYFQTMRTPLLKGRWFTAQDRDDAPGVALVNEAAARRFWPGEEATGKRIKLGPNTDKQPWLTIVGVVGDVRQFGVDTESKPEVYQNYLQRGPSSMTLAVRTASKPSVLVPGVRAQVLALDKDLPIYDVRTGEQLVAESIAKRRFSTFLLSTLAGIALVLAAAGIYALMSYSVTQRTHELGLRMALGARREDALRLILGQAMTLTGAAVLIGWLTSFALTHLMESLLFETRMTDPATFVAVSLTLFAVALLACFLPAHRATKVEPLTALRYE